MPSCAAFGCKNRGSQINKKDGVTFHRFPNDKLMRKAWIVAVRRKEFVPSNASCICSEHFESSDFDKTSAYRTYLKKDAVPSVFKALPKNLQITKPLLQKREIPTGVTTHILKMETSAEPPESSHIDMATMPISEDVDESRRSETPVRSIPESETVEKNGIFTKPIIENILTMESSAEPPEIYDVDMVTMPIGEDVDESLRSETPVRSIPVSQTVEKNGIFTKPITENILTMERSAEPPEISDVDMVTMPIVEDVDESLRSESSVRSIPVSQKVEINGVFTKPIIENITSSTVHRNISASKPLQHGSKKTPTIKIEASTDKDLVLGLYNRLKQTPFAEGSNNMSFVLLEQNPRDDNHAKVQQLIRQVNTYKVKVEMYKRKVRTLQQTNRRQNRKITKLKKALKDMDNSQDTDEDVSESDLSEDEIYKELLRHQKEELEENS